MVEAENFLDHPPISYVTLQFLYAGMYSLV
jgi:hypothetical protein